jgi:hypothetical protein
MSKSFLETRFGTILRELIYYACGLFSLTEVLILDQVFSGKRSLRSIELGSY